VIEIGQFEACFKGLRVTATTKIKERKSEEKQTEYNSGFSAEICTENLDNDLRCHQRFPIQVFFLFLFFGGSERMKFHIVHCVSKKAGPAFLLSYL